MSANINKSAKCFIGYIDRNPVCFFACIHFPHPRVRNFKKGHRLVVLPDYQGLGIGHLFSTEIAEHYLSNDFRFIITSSTKSLFNQRSLDKRWMITRVGRTKNAHGVLKNTSSNNKLTYSYEYLGDKPTNNVTSTKICQTPRT